MTSRERVLTALKGGIPDRVPWIEAYIHSSLAGKITDQIIKLPNRWRIPLGVHEKICLDNLSFDFRPPYYAEVEKHGDLEMIRTEKLKTWKDLEALKDWLPDPYDEKMYVSAKNLLKNKNQYATIACIRLGIANVYNSMGYNDFIYNLYDNPDLINAAFEIYGDWCTKVIDRVNEMDFDIAWIAEDIAFSFGPMVSPEQYKKHIFPYAKKVADRITLPKIYHSDGNYEPILDYILQLKPDGLANLEPPAMNIFKLKETIGKRVCLVGNIDMHYTLTRGSVQETINEVREKILNVGRGGGYIIATSNGLSSYCKSENVIAMNDAILKYGYYK